MNIHVFSTDVSCFELVDSLSGEDRVACVIYPKNRAGSAKVEALLAEAGRRNVPVHEHRRDVDIFQEIAPAEAGVSWLYSQIISTRDIAGYPGGMLNMHGGAIPQYRGASVLHWALVNGEDELGVTWHEIVEQVDAGGIWAESRIPILPGDTALDVRKRLVREGVRLFPEAWARFRARAGEPRYPDLAQGRVWRQRRPEDSCIGENWPERRVRDLVRAMCAPWPRAFVQTPSGPFCVDRVATAPEQGYLAYVTAEGKTLYLAPVEENS